MVEGLAGGGILAFDGENGSYIPEGTEQGGVPNQAALKEWLEAQEELKNFKASPAMTRQEREELEQYEFDRRQKFAGADPYAPMAEKIKGLEQAQTKDYDRGLGLAALEAIPAILEGGNAVRGIGAGAGKFGGSVSQLDKARTAEKRALASMDFNLKDAQRKERMGLTKDAMASATDAQKDRIAADKAQLEALKARAKGATDAGRAFRTTGGAGGAGNKEWAFAVQKYLPLIKEENPDIKDQATLEGLAYEKYQQGRSAGYQGAAERTAVAADTSKEAAWAKMSRKEKKSIAAANDVDVTKPDWLAKTKELHMGTAVKPAAAKPKPAGANSAKVSGMPDGSTLGKTTKDGIEVFDANGKLIGYATK
jgi:hypothetical protein